MLECLKLFMYVLFRLKTYSNLSSWFCSTQSTRQLEKCTFHVGLLPQSYTPGTQLLYVRATQPVHFPIECIISVLFKPVTKPVVV